MSTTPPDDPYGDDPYGPQQQGPYPAHDPYEGLEQPPPPLNPASSPLEPRRASYAAAPPPQKPKRKKWPWVLLALALLSILFLFAFCRAFVGALDDPEPAAPASPSAAHGSVVATPTKAKKAEPYVAEVTKCESGEFGFDATVKIKNNTDDEATYFFDLLLLDKDDNTVGTGIGSIKVKAGKSGETTLLAALDESYKGKKSDVDCEVKVTDF